MSSIPLRQPRGPSTISFAGPPEPDADSLRRSNTVSTPRHQPSASVSSTPASTSAFHGSRFRNAASRFRSGSLSSGNEPGPVARGNLREAPSTEEVLIEDEEGGGDGSQWAKGLSRQSSLPSRRFANPVNAMGPPDDIPPPRPPRRNLEQIASSPNHMPSHSLSSLTMFSPPSGNFALEEPVQGASVSRTQSLRAQAKHSETTLGRSSSLRSTGQPHATTTLGRSSSLRGVDKHQDLLGPFTPPTPPPVSSTAALPPYQFQSSGADIKRHQSLGHHHGRVRPDPNVALLSLDQREDLRRRLNAVDPPTSPIGHSVWSAQAGEGGWGNVPLHEAFETMQLARKPSNRTPPVQSSNDEPSWVANLVGQADPARNWHERQDARWDQGYGTQPYPFPPKSYAPVPYMPYPTPPHTAMLQNHDMAVIELARSKGLNPATFNCRPQSARFFVIKSYTEDDVQKSLKHEIWSSTVLGNKRLDGAFRESADTGPIYLFFSVNGSRHFCGVAQMLTPVDENQTSTVWAQDKWKGIFRVKWIFVRDVPSA